ncbi:armadillo-type protein [Myxozyma melibiosi]|uniref:Clathrin heavy chain n=1 Tax=Myxozyma melibiosi TaxID=54550 RepID=A0ABR1F4U8_9ASCO
MNPSQNVLALRAQGRTLQIFNLDLKQKLKSHVMDEDVVYWKWFNDKSIVLVTDTSIYHWDIIDSTQAAPVKITERHVSLAACQLINYHVDHDGKWSVLVGIASEQGRVVGHMQLYSMDRKQSQPIEGHAATFARLRLDGATSDSKLFSFATRSATGAKLHIIEIDPQAAGPKYAKKAVDIYIPADAASDFPVALQASEKYGILYMLTKHGFIHLYDLDSGTCIFMNRICNAMVFTSTIHTSSSGIMAINRKGQVLSVAVDENTVIPYILKTLQNPGIAIALASRAGLSGADDLYVQQFSQLIAAGQYADAARVAATSPRGILRTPQTIEQFKHLPSVPGQPSPILQYFGTLLDKGTLNRHESIELARPVLSSNKKALLEKWLKENKLECSEELGDVVHGYDPMLALSVYLRGNAPAKVVACFAETGQFEKILPYCSKVGYTPDFSVLLQNLVRINPEKGAEFATQLANHEGGALVDLSKVVDIFMSQNMIQQATAFLLDALKDNLPEQGALQTRLLEMNLMSAPQVADAILGNDMFSYYDKSRIAMLCEKAGLFQRALEHYEDIGDIKRVIVHTNVLNPDWLVQFFGNKLSVEQSLECLHEMLRVNIRQNLQVVIQIAIKYSDLLGPQRIISLFEEFKSFEGLYYYLQSTVNLTQDPDVVLKYIRSACQIGQFTEVERICRDNNVYNPEKVKNFLKEAKLADQLPLIIVCDRFNYIHDLVLYLYQNQQFQFIETYVQKVNPTRTPAVIGGLLDVDCEESIIKTLLQSVMGLVPLDELVDEVEKRNRLKLILPFLEATMASGSQDPALYNALAKIYIDSNNNPEKFLRENSLYNSLIVGKYCEKRDPYLAFIAYEKGQNDVELIQITNENSMFKHQARYLVARADAELWALVLNENNIHRRQLVDQVVATAVPESSSPDDVSVAVQAFMSADLPIELIELLEKIVLEPSPFNDNTNLQNLLILTAIKADKAKVMDYIHRLDSYDADDIAQIAIDSGLHEEGFEIYKKQKNHQAAIGVLVDHIMSLDRAETYAEKVDTPEVWSLLGRAQLNGLRINDSIESYIRANDPSNYLEVIEIASRAGKDDELIKFLNLARKTIREPAVDSQLLLSYARVGKLPEFEELLSGANVANVEEVGDSLFEEKNYDAARILYRSISNWAKLASTLVYIGDYQAAVDSARKAGSIKVWKQVNEACIDKKEFRLAQICGLNLIVHAEELLDLVNTYEKNGYFDELIALLEQGLGLERAHMGMFTELAILYSKYHPEKMMEHLKLFWSRINIPKAIRACEDAHLWPELVFLYCHYDEWDNAALAIMEHAADAFEHSAFKEIIVKVANLEIYYRALNFYLAEQPQLLTDLLTALTPRIDVTRVVRMFEKSDNIPLIKPFLVAVQNQNNAAVNKAYHELLIEEEDYKSLRDSVDNFDNFDPLDLAKRLESDGLIFFRQIAARIYRNNKRWAQSIELSKSDKLFKDAIETAAVSGKIEVVEELLQYFVDVGNKECYAAMLYTCYDLIREDIVAELSWRHSLSDFTTPYLINKRREQETKIKSLEAFVEEQKAKEKENQAAAEMAPMGPILGGGRLMLTQGMTGM